MKNYTYTTTRQGSLNDIKAWYVGESQILKDLIGAGFYNTIYICEKGMVSFYYRQDEIQAFEEALEEVDEELFNFICTDFMMLCNRIMDMKTDNDKLELFSLMIPALTIFYEFDIYPDYMNNSMKRRLLRVRENSEAIPYELLKDIKKSLKDFILYKSRTYTITRRYKQK